MAFEKQLIAKNEGKINSEIQQLNPTKEYLQGYVNKVIALGINVAENDLELLFSNPKAYITDKLTAGETMQVGGLKLDKEKLFDLIEKPTGTNDLIESIIKDNQNTSTREYHIWKINQFTVSSDLVTIKQTALDHIQERNSLFVENENQKTGFEKLQQITQLINEINQLDGQKIDLNTDLVDLMEKSNNRFEVKPQTVKRFR